LLKILYKCLLLSNKKPKRKYKIDNSILEMMRITVAISVIPFKIKMEETKIIASSIISVLRMQSYV